MIMVGLIEEAAKLIVPLLVLIFSSTRRSRDGVIIGVASGMGFATLETMGTASALCCPAAIWPRLTRPCSCGRCSPPRVMWPGPA